MSPSLISIVITTYNREQYLARAVNSILDQTYPHFELLLWDDGSTDQSPTIAQTYAQKDTRIRAITAKHQGRGYALHSAFSFTQGDFVAIVDSDDWLAPTALEETSQCLIQEPDVGMVYTNYIDVNAQGKSIGLGHRCHIPYSKDRLLLDFMIFHFRLIRRHVFDQVGGFDPQFSYAPDYDLCLKLSEVTDIVHLKRPLYFYRRHSTAISSQKQFQQLEFSHRAVTNAVKRRGLDENLSVGVELRPKFVFKRKRASETTGKIFGIGLGKTGTTSLCGALTQLGYRTLHAHCLGDLTPYDAAADTPIAVAFRELDWSYPNSKFVLTLRDIDQWLASWKKHDAKVRQINQGELPSWVKSLRRKAFGQWEFEPHVWKATYDLHLSEVVSYFQTREQDLLVLDICAGDGWEKLCPFLNQPVPSSSFPHQNRASSPIT